AKLVPLGALEERAKEFVGEKPVVTVCRSGARSAQASVILRKHGLARTANLAGGMLRWRALGYPVEGARD
ncbi:MAG: rhodanese-like domain-containing protein, partial [Burkholderiales bacterium]|nr:rhodanese-like domain-containing protein [Burkholderiales bacterium]